MYFVGVPLDDKVFNQLADTTMPYPTTKRWICLCAFVLFGFCQADAQLRDLRFANGKAKFEIPFEYENNFIIVELLFNGVFPLKFIFDTGAEHTILTKREITDILQVDYTRRFTLLGADLSSELYAYLAPGVSMQLKDLTAVNRSILVLDEDYFQFEELTGIAIHGILGADFFRRFVVKIDYRREKIVLYDPRRYRGPARRFSEIPIEIKRNKPYVRSSVLMSIENSSEVKLLVDTGASLALMLYTSTHPDLSLPEQFVRTKLGMGLGGYIEGFLGRLEQFTLGEYELGGVVTNFQDVLPVVDTIYLNDRNGILGNQILQRFDIIIDYIQSKAYIAPNRNFKRKFKYDRSGISLVVGGENLSHYKVLKVIGGSPAELAGVMEGDRLLSINRLPVSFQDLDRISRTLKKKPGKRIRLLLRRDGEKVRVKFRLKDLI